MIDDSGKLEKRGKDCYTSFAVNHINHIRSICNLHLMRLSKLLECDEFPMFEFALNGRDYSYNTIVIYYINGTWKMTSFCGINFDYKMLSSAIIPFIRFLNLHGHEVDFNEIRKTFGIEEDQKWLISSSPYSQL